MTVKILHFSDSHLDVPATKFGPRRFERKQDFLQAFDTVVEYALEKRPDIVLHTGDLFNGINPRNPARAHVMTAFRKLHSQGIRIFFISGNHDVPRARQSGISPLVEYANAGFITLFEDWEKVGSETINIDGLDLEISGVSYDPTIPASSAVDPLSQTSIPGKGDINILLVHYNVEGFRGTFPTSPTIRLKSLPKKLTYLAVGHIHEHQKQKVGNTTICVPGSTEHVSFAEEKHRKGFVWIEANAEGVQKSEFIPVKTRPMRTVTITIPTDADINSLLFKEINKLRNPQLILRFLLKGVMTIKSAERYRRSEAIRQGIAQCFSVEIVDNLEYISPELTLPSGELALKPPITEYRDHLTAAIEQEKDPVRKVRLQKALERGIALLEEKGGW
jgi:DNA repair exonuclease SbcCD nuclease subunit